MSVLTPNDWQSAVWMKLKAHYEARLAELRTKNDSDMTEAKTITLRAEIREVKRFLAIGTSPRKPIAHDAFKDQ